MDEEYIELFKKTEETIETNTASYKEYQFLAEDFLDRSTIFYGTTGSGKTYFAKYCLNGVKNYFPRVVLFSTTNELSGDFKGIINPAVSYNELTEYKFVECMKAQIEVAEMYRKVNRLDLLCEVFNLCANNKQKEMYKNIERITQRACEAVGGESESLRAGEIQRIRDTINEKLRGFFRSVIIPLRNSIDIEQLSADARDCVKYIDINPRTLFIFDDVQEELKEMLGKKKSEAALMFKNLFTRGRHYFITHWYMLQDDSSMPPPLRKNAKISVLTTGDIANGFITRATNGISKEDQKLGLGLIGKLFGGKDYRKIIYFKERSGQDKFQYHTARDCGLFFTGSSIINEFCNEIL